MRIGLNLIATGKYVDFLDPIIESAVNNFFPNEDVSYIIHTNQTDRDFHKNCIVNKIDSEPWPNPTLKRFHYFLMKEDVIRGLDFCFYVDVDSLFVNPVDLPLKEMHGIIPTLHPGFYGTSGTPERRPESKAYIPPGSNNLYFCGGFFGGDKDSISQMNVLYYDLMSSTLKSGYMGTEESLFTILLYQHPSLIDYCKIELNGLVYKFFEDVKNDKVVLKNEGKKVLTNYNGDVGLYVITFNSPDQFRTLLRSMEEYDIDFLKRTKKFLLDNSTDLSTTPEYLELCEKYGFEHIKKDNIGITGGRVFIAEHFHETDLEYYMFFEDDMFFYSGPDSTCRNGFSRKIKNLYDKVLQVMFKEEFDFLKFNFTEFYGSHEKQWSWYNVDQEFRKNHWPNYNKLPVQGQDPNSPCLEYKNIKSYEGLPYASGEIYLSNWPIILSKDGNYKCYIETKFHYPYEQTLMSHCYKETIKGKINAGLLLTTPTEHNRFDFYEGGLRKEF